MLIHLIGRMNSYSELSSVNIPGAAWYRVPREYGAT
jgi:hypothetical protein